MEVELAANSFNVCNMLSYWSITFLIAGTRTSQRVGHSGLIFVTAADSLHWDILVNVVRQRIDAENTAPIFCTICIEFLVNVPVAQTFSATQFVQ